MNDDYPPEYEPTEEEAATAAMFDALEDAWGVIANAHGGEWGLAEPDWVQAAVRFREKWNAILDQRRQPQ